MTIFAKCHIFWKIVIFTKYDKENYGWESILSKTIKKSVKKTTQNNSNRYDNLSLRFLPISAENSYLAQSPNPH